MHHYYYYKRGINYQSLSHRPNYAPLRIMTLLTLVDQITSSNTVSTVVASFPLALSPLALSTLLAFVATVLQLFRLGCPRRRALTQSTLSPKPNGHTSVLFVVSRFSCWSLCSWNDGIA